MLRNNLSSRPFYNERAVSLVLGAVALVALALTAYNATEIYGLSRQRAALHADVTRDSEATADIRQQTSTIRTGLEVPVLSGLLVSTQEANSLIDQRTFSWTVLFDYVGRTLPYDVRLVAVAPLLDRGRFMVKMIVVARQPEDLETFFAALRETGAFSDVTSTAEQVQDDGTLRADVQAAYTPPKLATPPGKTGDAPAAGPAAPAGEAPAARTPGRTNGTTGGRP
ncbi:MAG: hypothetical protein R2752_19700 [Vicinamibacterales bacterium]